MAKQAVQFDIVLANGRVIDPETYLDGSYNVGIRGGQIAAISDQTLKGKEVVGVIRDGQQGFDFIDRYNLANHDSTRCT